MRYINLRLTYLLFTYLPVRPIGGRRNQPFNGHIAEQRNMTQQYGDWYWPLMGGLLYLVQ